MDGRMMSIFRILPASIIGETKERIMVSDLFDLSGKVALVTGGSKGLGKAMARGLAEAGADIAISSRHEDELRPALDAILKGTGRKGCYLTADMGKRDQTKQLA